MGKVLQHDFICLLVKFITIILLPSSFNLQTSLFKKVDSPLYLATHTEVGGSCTVYTFLLAFSWIFYSEDSEGSFYRNKSFSYIKIWKGYKWFLFNHYCENKKRGRNSPHFHLNMSLLQSGVRRKLLLRFWDKTGCKSYIWDIFSWSVLFYSVLI